MGLVTLRTWHLPWFNVSQVTSPNGWGGQARSLILFAFIAYFMDNSAAAAAAPNVNAECLNLIKSFTNHKVVFTFEKSFYIMRWHLVFLPCLWLVCECVTHRLAEIHLRGTRAYSFIWKTNAEKRMLTRTMASHSIQMRHWNLYLLSQLNAEDVRPHAPILYATKRKQTNQTKRRRRRQNTMRWLNSRYLQTALPLSLFIFFHHSQTLVCRLSAVGSRLFCCCSLMMNLCFFFVCFSTGLTRTPHIDWWR